MLVKKSFSLAGHRTSVALEAPFWGALEALAAARGTRLAGLVAGVDAARVPGETLASRLRVLALMENKPKTRDAVNTCEAPAGSSSACPKTEYSSGENHVDPGRS